MSSDRPFDEPAGDPAEWEAVELEVRKPAGVVLSVRVSGELYARVERCAVDNSTTPLELIRRATAAVVAGQSFGSRSS
jgi:hypothetical protein